MTHRTRPEALVTSQPAGEVTAADAAIYNAADRVLDPVALRAE
jgi:hypothetical protein